MHGETTIIGDLGSGLPDIPYLQETLVFLMASVLIVPLFQRMRASPVLGYLAAGVLVGPHGLGLIAEGEGIGALAKFGVVFLLFMIGIKLSAERVAAMKQYVLGLGLAQVLVTAAVIGCIAWLWGNSPEVSILLGGCFALSSTAVVSQILLERNELLTHKGRVTIAVLLAQDLAVVPLLVMVNVFSQNGNAGLAAELGMAAIKAVIAVVVIMVTGRLAVRPLFRALTAVSPSPELFAALTLLVVLVTSIATSMAGLSMELGALLAGLLLAETEFHNRIENDLRPFQGLLLGLFFITVGMSIDVTAVLDSLLWLAASVVGLFVIKSLIIAMLGLALGVEKKIAVPSAIMLGQGGEFLYVVVGAAIASQLIPDATGQFMLLVTALSMLATPLLAWLSNRAEAKLSGGARHP